MSDPVVETAQGRVGGELRNGVVVFRGLPFAAPPVASRRWLPPAPPSSWSGVRPGRAFGPAAPQLAAGHGLVGRLARLVRGRMSEDCLYLNVWAAHGHKRLPVMVWIHGGAFVLGAGSTFLYDGSALAAQGAVVVTLNYRLGALGYLDLSTLGESRVRGNLGLLDVRAALDWVGANIERFGGDPERVTVFGESAGAMLIGALLATGRPGFRRAVLQSGAASNVASRRQAAAVGKRFLAAAGVPDGRLERLQGLPLEKVLAAQLELLRAPGARLGLLPWQPTVDGTVLAEPPLAAIRRGAAAGIDLLLGTTRDEWKLFTGAATLLRAMSERDLARRVGRLLEHQGRDPGAAERTVELYRRRSPDASPYELWVALRTDQFFRAPCLELAEAHAPATAPTYLYRFDLPVPGLARSFGACHGAELPLVFGTHGHPALRLLYRGTEAAALALEMQRSWLGFAAKGRPAGDQWRPFDPARPVLTALGARPRLEPMAPDPALDVWRAARP